MKGGENKMIKKIVAGAGLGFLSLLAAPMAFAAADASVLQAATTTATTLADNVQGAVVEVLPIIVIVGALIITVLLVWRLAKRFISGR